MEKHTVGDVVAKVKNGENIEVLGYDGDFVIVDKVRGIVKGDFASEDLSELKKRKPRAKPKKEQLILAGEVVERLCLAKRQFKIVFGPGEVTIRTGGGFMRVVEGGVKLAGYKTLDDDPIPLLIDLFKKYGEVKLLKVLK